jgi:hypothetical protein
MMCDGAGMGLVLADLPESLRWEYGGFAYGLEPLTLPHSRAADQADAGDLSAEPTSAGRDDAYADVCRLIRLLDSRDIPPGTVERYAAEDELFWFRWITGHQVSFISWRLMAQLLTDNRQERLPPPGVLSALCSYVSAYTAMLLYTGSCPRNIYHRLIRPSMRLRHRSFSGGWAPDFGPVRDLLRARRLPFAAPESADLLRAVSLQQTVHDGIAAKLVPDGRSLLRQSCVRGADPRLLSVIYDSYFMTLRGPVSRHDVVAQLLRRLIAIAQDVAVNGLHPVPAADRAELPEELQMSEVISCETRLTSTLLEVASCAVRQPADLRADLPGLAHASMGATDRTQ